MHSNALPAGAFTRGPPPPVSRPPFSHAQWGQGCAECSANRTGGAGEYEGQKKFVYLKWADHFWRSIQKVHFSPEEHCYGFGWWGGLA